MQSTVLNRSVTPVCSGQKLQVPCSSLTCSTRALTAQRPVVQRHARTATPVVCQAAATVQAAPRPANSTDVQRKPNTDKYAVIEVGGTQHLVEEGRWYTCNRLQVEPGSKIQFGRVLALKLDGEFHIGRPYLSGITVEAEIVEELKGPKLTIFKYKPKKHYRRTTGHRQPLTKFMITKITRAQ